MKDRTKKDLEDLVTIGVAAEIMGVCIKTMRNWHKKEKIEPVYINKSTKVRYYSRKGLLKLIKTKDKDE